MTDTGTIDLDPQEQEQPETKMPPAETGNQVRIPGVRRSTRVRAQPKEYMSSMRGIAYDVAAAQ